METLTSASGVAAPEAIGCREEMTLPALAIPAEQTAVATVLGTNSVTSELQAIAKINEHHRLAEASYAEHAIECGKLLLRQKRRAGYGNFGKWIAANCQFSHATANNYMFAARLASQNPNALGKSIRHRFPSGRKPEPRKTLPASQAATPPAPSHSPAAAEPSSGDFALEQAIALIRRQKNFVRKYGRHLDAESNSRKATERLRKELARAELIHRNAATTIIGIAMRIEAEKRQEVAE
jgi:hypothetical protein